MKLKSLLLLFVLSGCMQYVSPAHEAWDSYLSGASFMDMTETSKIAKRPVYLGHGGKLLNTNIDKSATLDYGDKATNDNLIGREYMAKLEYELYDSLRTAGVSVERAGTDVVVILVRDAIIARDKGDISPNGADTLGTVARILRKYNSNTRIRCGMQRRHGVCRWIWPNALVYFWHEKKLIRRVCLLWDAAPRALSPPRTVWAG